MWNLINTYCLSMTRACFVFSQSLIMLCFQPGLKNYGLLCPTIVSTADAGGFCCDFDRAFKHVCQMMISQMSDDYSK